MPEGGEKEALAETAGPEQDIKASLLFQFLYVGCVIDIQVPFRNYIFKVS